MVTTTTSILSILSVMVWKTQFYFLSFLHELYLFRASINQGCCCESVGLMMINFSLINNHYICVKRVVISHLLFFVSMQFIIFLNFIIFCSLKFVFSINTTCTTDKPRLSSQYNNVMFC